MWRVIVTVLAVGILVAGCSVAGSSPPASPSGPASGTAPMPSLTPAASIADPESSAPSPSLETYAPVGSPEPAGSALVIHRTWDDIGPHLDLTVVLADGRVISMERGLEHPYVLEERRLSWHGLEIILAEVTANPLFERSQWRPLAASPPACCGAGDEIVFAREGQEITVGRAILPDGVYAPSAAWDDFERLLGRLDGLETWLPADAWEQLEPRPYAAPAYRLSVGSPASDDRPLGSIDWPAGLDPTAFGAPLPDDPATRCDVVDARTALAIAAQADALRDAQGVWLPHPTLAEAGLFDSFIVAAPTDGRPLAVALRALLPHQAAADAAATCAVGY